MFSESRKNKAVLIMSIKDDPNNALQRIYAHGQSEPDPVGFYKDVKYLIYIARRSIGYDMSSDPFIVHKVVV